MNKTFRFSLLVILLIAALTLSAFGVLAKEITSMTISGPGINGQMTLTDAAGLTGLMQSGFFDTVAYLVNPPKNLGTGYLITAYIDLGDQVAPFVQAEYFPAAEGETGYIHYTGLLRGEPAGLEPARSEERRVGKECRL